MSTKTKSKALIRAMSRVGVTSGKTRPGTRRLQEPSACDRCGALFQRRVWRRSGPISPALLARVKWVTCPACMQARVDVHGRVRIEGEQVATHEDLIRRRIENVGARAAATQPERRVLSVDRVDGGLEVLTTSQKLAHRLVHELKKVLGGKATYEWSDDGSLYATWKPARRAGHGRNS
jgi:hypothetical protein